MIDIEKILFLLFAMVAASLGFPAVAARGETPHGPSRPPTAKKAQYDAALRAEILAMAADDQRVRQKFEARYQEIEKQGVIGLLFNPLVWEMGSVDRRHERRMKQIIARHGWPGRSLVGEDGADRAWLIVQHCRLPFQEKCLPLLEASVKAGEAEAKNYAYLIDRVHMYRNEPQIYGTQFQNNELYRLEDPAHVDQRRHSVGLDSLAEGERRVRQRYHIPAG